MPVPEQLHCCKKFFHATGINTHIYGTAVLDNYLNALGFTLIGIVKEIGFKKIGKAHQKIVNLIICGAL